MPIISAEPASIPRRRPWRETRCEQRHPGEEKEQVIVKITRSFFVRNEKKDLTDR